MTEYSSNQQIRMEWTEMLACLALQGRWGRVVMTPIIPMGFNLVDQV